jgi:hypothetical protein
MWTGEFYPFYLAFYKHHAALDAERSCFAVIFRLECGAGMPTAHLRARNSDKLPQPLIYGSSILQFLHNVSLLFG